MDCTEDSAATVGKAAFEYECASVRETLAVGCAAEGNSPFCARATGERTSGHHHPHSLPAADHTEYPDGELRGCCFPSCSWLLHRQPAPRRGVSTERRTAFPMPGCNAKKSAFSASRSLCLLLRRRSVNYAWRRSARCPARPALPCAGRCRRLHPPGQRQRLRDPAHVRRGTSSGGAATPPCAAAPPRPSRHLHGWGGGCLARFMCVPRPASPGPEHATHL